MRLNKAVRWAWHFGQFCPTWKSFNRKERREAIRQFIYMDSQIPKRDRVRVLANLDILPLTNWILAGKGMFTALQNEMKAKWLTPAWEGFGANRDCMPPWLFAGFYGWMPKAVAQQPEPESLEVADLKARIIAEAKAMLRSEAA